MTLYFILLGLYLLLTGAVISATFAERSLPGHRPPIYWDEYFMHLINFLIFPVIILFIILMILKWDITLVVTVIALLFGRILARISEYLIVLPLYAYSGEVDHLFHSIPSS